LIIKNFGELDKILKNTFKKIRDEIQKGDGKLGKEISNFKKIIENSKKSINSIEKNTKASLNNIEKKTKDSIHNIELNTKNSIKEGDKKLSDFKKEVNALKRSQNKVLNDAEKKISSKIEYVNKTIDGFKKDFIKVVKVIKTKSISQEVFEKRMKNTDENTKKLAVHIKEIIELRDNLSDIKQNKSMLAELSAKVGKLSGTANESVNELKSVQSGVKEISKRAVDKEEFDKEIKDVKTRLDNELKEVVTNLKEVNKIKDLQLAVGEISKKGASEDELKKLKSDQVVILKDLKEEIRLIKKEVATKDSLKNEVEKLRAQLKELKVVMSDWNKRINQELKLKSESGKFMKQVSSIFDERKETKITEKEEIELDLKEMEEVEQKPGVLKKAVDGIVDFFVEDEDEIVEEEIRKIEEVKKKAKPKAIKTKKEKKVKKRQPKIEIIEEIAQIEKVEEEKEEKEDKERMTRDGPGVLTKMKDGMVNFFFEEVDEAAEEELERKKEKEEASKRKMGLEVYEAGTRLGKGGKKKTNGSSAKGRKTGSKKFKKLDKDTFVDDFGKETTYYPEDYFY